ncbi:MAG: hypothetical protein Q8880_01890 [Bacteroidota bacterium]|nr:hypothetical protein [Bacteroidota bacterium]
MIKYLYVFILFFLVSCIKENPTEISKDKYPYYSFQTTDKEWFNYKNGETLIFRNQNNLTDTFTVFVEHNLKMEAGIGMGIGSTFSTVYYYYDEEKYNIMSMKSGLGLYSFDTTLPDGYTKENPPFNVKGEFVMSYFGLIDINKFSNFLTLTANNKTYNYVIKGVSDGKYARDDNVKIMYYDKFGGIIRYELYNGTIWDLIVRK